MLSLGSSPGSSAGRLPPQTRGPKPQGGLTVRGRKFPVEDKVHPYPHPLCLIDLDWRIKSKLSRPNSRHTYERCVTEGVYTCLVMIVDESSSIIPTHRSQFL
jgi:hypothetical protein